VAHKSSFPSEEEEIELTKIRVRHQQRIEEQLQYVLSLSIPC
jgi:hypothetical protein